MQSSPASAHPRFFGDWDLPLQPTREDAPHKVSTQRLQSCPSANPANPASDRECNPVRQVRIPDFSAIGICPCNRREKTRLIGIDPTSAILSICKSRKSCFRPRMQSSPASAHPRFFGDWDLPLQPTREDAPHRHRPNVCNPVHLQIPQILLQNTFAQKTGTHPSASMEGFRLRFLSAPPCGTVPPSHYMRRDSLANTDH